MMLWDLCQNIRGGKDIGVVFNELITIKVG